MSPTLFSLIVKEWAYALTSLKSLAIFSQQLDKLQ